MRRVFRMPASHARLARDVDEELAFHLETRVRQLIASGMHPDAARREAERRFGDVESVRQSCVTMDEQRELSMRRANYVSEVLQDLAFTARTLRRNAGFAALVVGALATGIGANTAIFSMIDAVFVRGLPVLHPEQLVAIGDPTRVNSHSGGSPRTDLLSVPVYRDVRTLNDVFTDVFASGRTDRLDVRIDGSKSELEHPRGRFESGNYFTVLGVHAAVGRTFDASADSLTGSAVPLTISYGYWIRRFHGDRSVVGRSLTIDDVRFSIVGVAPASFTGEIVEQFPDMWIPLGAHDAMRPHQPALQDRYTSWLLLMGRLKPGVILARAQSEIGPLVIRSIVNNSPPPVVSGFQQGHPKNWVSPGTKGFSRVRSTFETPLFTLMVGVALLLCIVCANVANLLLARAISRGREMSVRLALGANRARLVRQLLTESAVLALASATIGLVVARLSSRWLIGLAAGGGALSIGSGLSSTVLAFTIVVSVLAVAVFGLAPALYASRVDLAATMRAGAQPAASTTTVRGLRRRPLGSLLVSGQVALSVVLLIGAAILVRSLRNLQDTNIGMDRDHLVIADLDILAPGYLGTPLTNLVHSLRDRVGAIPGVSAVTFSENGIFSGSDSHTTIEIPGFAARIPDDTTIAYDNVGPNYAGAIGGRVIAGRDLTSSDENKPARTILVNQDFAEFYFPHESAIGKYVHFNDTIAVQIVGVIADVRDHSLTAKLDRRMYFPYVHTDTSQNQLGNVGALRLEIRTAGAPSALVNQIRRTIVSVDPKLPIDGIDPLPTLVADNIRQEILLARLATAFGALALLLAAIGMYGVMSYSVARRTGEIGLRTALGAQREDVVRLVLRDAMTLVFVGLVVGLPLAMALMRLLKAQLHGVGTADPRSIVLAVVLLVASAVVAVMVPALRASRVSPIVALRES